MNFVSNEELKKTDSTLKSAYFAGGCFWGVEHLLQQREGVEAVVSGYMGGHTEDPTYREVCSQSTGHLEVVEVKYRPEQVDFTTLAKLFFEIHDPTQVGGQGPDSGEQYGSAIFFQDDEEKQASQQLIELLQSKGLRIATRLLPMSTFWPAEDYHQDYYQKNGNQPYCHQYQSRF